MFLYHLHISQSLYQGVLRVSLKKYSINVEPVCYSFVSSLLFNLEIDNEEMYLMQIRDACTGTFLSSVWSNSTD